jgi:hypothetical protein
MDGKLKIFIWTSTSGICAMSHPTSKEKTASAFCILAYFLPLSFAIFFIRNSYMDFDCSSLFWQLYPLVNSFGRDELCTANSILWTQTYLFFLTLVILNVVHLILLWGTSVSTGRLAFAKNAARGTLFFIFATAAIFAIYFFRGIEFSFLKFSGFAIPPFGIKDLVAYARVQTILFSSVAGLSGVLGVTSFFNIKSIIQILGVKYV